MPDLIGVIQATTRGRFLFLPSGSKRHNSNFRRVGGKTDEIGSPVRWKSRGVGALRALHHNDELSSILRSKPFRGRGPKKRYSLRSVDRHSITHPLVYITAGKASLHLIFSTLLVVRSGNDEHDEEEKAPAPEG